MMILSWLIWDLNFLIFEVAELEGQLLTICILVHNLAITILLLHLSKVDHPLSEVAAVFVNDLNAVVLVHFVIALWCKWLQVFHWTSSNIVAGLILGFATPTSSDLIEPDSGCFQDLHHILSD